MAYDEAVLEVLNTLKPINQIVEENRIDRRLFNKRVLGDFDYTPEHLRQWYRAQTDIRAASIVGIECHLVSTWNRLTTIHPHHRSRDSELIEKSHAGYFRWDGKVDLKIDGATTTIKVDDLEYNMEEDCGEEMITYFYPIDVAGKSPIELRINLRRREHQTPLITTDLYDKAGMYLMDRAEDMPHVSLRYRYRLYVVVSTEVVYGKEYPILGEEKIDKEPKTPTNENPPSEKERPMSTNNENPTLNAIFERVLIQLAESNESISTIIAESEIPQPQFYKEFRQRYGITPSEYRENARQEALVAEREQVREEEPFTFSVAIHQPTGSAPAGMGQRDLSASLMIPFVVNGQYAFIATVYPLTGKSPTFDPNAFMRSDYRDQFNAEVVEALMPYFHGQLNIAYLQHAAPYMGMPPSQAPMGRFRN